jgi:hypothetical protein
VFTLLVIVHCTTYSKDVSVTPFQVTPWILESLSITKPGRSSTSPYCSLLPCLSSSDFVLLDSNYLNNIAWYTSKNRFLTRPCARPITKWARSPIPKPISCHLGPLQRLSSTTIVLTPLSLQITVSAHPSLDTVTQARAETSTSHPPQPHSTPFALPFPSLRTIKHVPPLPSKQAISS